MAFLSMEGRFGPDLDAFKQGEPNPCTYTPPVAGLALSPESHSSGTFGYHRPEQHEQPPHAAAAASCSPAVAATLKAMAANSLPELRGSAPDPWTYSPAARGQFPHVYTIQEIQAERKRSALRSRTVQHPVSEQGEAAKLHLALGPGSYEVDRDQNQEMIATPFTFTREKRHGILENTSALGREGCSPGPGVYRIESSTAVGSTSTLASAPFRSKNAATFISRVRSDSQLHQQELCEVARYSKELAASYQELTTSVQRLEKQLTTPQAREQTFQRFDKDVTQVEAYRRGPGSYAPVRNCPRVDAGGRRQKKDASDKEQDGDCHFSSRELGGLSSSSGPQKQQRNSFGGVASRDLLTSMVAAGHASAHTIGPGVYDAHRSSVVVPTHNVSYKPELQRPEEQQPWKPKTKLNSKNQVDVKVKDAVAGKVDVTGSKMSQREMWKAMRRGPALPSGQV